jgi:DivIVA domain-containing protein
VSTTFPRARRSRLGYNVDQVEEFLEEARRAYAAEHPSPSEVNAEGIRRVSFDMRKGGYSTSHVDAALERLEDAFAAREREKEFTEIGEAAWYAKARATAQAVLDRLDRPAGKRFKRVGFLATGYHPKDVDTFGDRLTGYFQDGKPMSVDEVRGVAFRTRRGGYTEAQVDLLLDSVVDVMLAVR